MILNKQRKRRTLSKLIKFLSIMVAIVLVFLGIHAYSVRYFNTKASSIKEIAEEFKQNAKEFAPTEEETKQATKKGVEKLVDWFFKGSKYVDENITQPVFELSNELAQDNYEKANERLKEKTGNNTSEIGLEKVIYWKTVDGDTIKILNSEDEFITIRLIGINTPESVASEEYLSQKGTENSDYGKMATKHTESVIENAIFKNLTDIYLSYDEERTDQYGRTLAYVWLKGDVDVNNESDVENYMLNARILKDGYAEDVVYEPNHKYANIFNRLRKTAESNQEGLWGYIDIYEYY